MKMLLLAAALFTSVLSTAHAENADLHCHYSAGHRDASYTKRLNFTVRSANTFDVSFVEIERDAFRGRYEVTDRRERTGIAQGSLYTDSGYLALDLDHGDVRTSPTYYNFTLRREDGRLVGRLLDPAPYEECLAETLNPEICHSQVIAVLNCYY